MTFLGKETVALRNPAVDGRLRVAALKERIRHPQDKTAFVQRLNQQETATMKRIYLGQHACRQNEIMNDTAGREKMSSQPARGPARAFSCHVNPGPNARSTGGAA